VCDIAGVHSIDQKTIHCRRRAFRRFPSPFILWSEQDCKWCRGNAVSKPIRNKRASGDNMPPVYVKFLSALVLPDTAQWLGAPCLFLVLILDERRLQNTSLPASLVMLQDNSDDGTGVEAGRIHVW